MIRDVKEEDADAIAAIYAHHVAHGTASYDKDAPSVDETRAKIRRIVNSSWPFIVADQDGSVVGYAYVTQFRDRAAYAWTCEDSIYVHPDCQGRGVGKALLQELLREGGSVRLPADDRGDRRGGAGVDPAPCGLRLPGSRQAARGWLEARALARQRLYADRARGRVERAAEYLIWEEVEALPSGEGEGWGRASLVVPAEPLQKTPGQRC